MSTTLEHSNTITTMLLDPTTNAAASASASSVEALTNQVHELEKKLKYMTAAVQQERSWPYRLTAVLDRLYQNIHGTDAPLELDKDEAWDRIAELVKADMDEDQELWSPLRDFTVSINYIVLVSGTVKARTATEARDLVSYANGDFEINDIEGVSDATIDEVTMDEVDISE